MRLKQAGWKEGSIRNNFYANLIRIKKDRKRVPNSYVTPIFLNYFYVIMTARNALFNPQPPPQLLHNEGFNFHMLLNIRHAKNSVLVR